MTRHTFGRIVALGAMTGVRSMAGITTLTASRRGTVSAACLTALSAEMVADKTSLVGDRTDALPLVGRALLGGAVGTLVAGPASRDALPGFVLGAATAVAATHLAYVVRTRLAPSGVAGGMLEDAMIAALAWRYA